MEQTPKTELAQKALAAMRDAIARVIAEHRRDNRPLAIWREGKVVWVDPYDLQKVREDTFTYRVDTNEL